MASQVSSGSPIVSADAARRRYEVGLLLQGLKGKPDRAALVRPGAWRPFP
mgnify:CR=1 FL=1